MVHQSSLKITDKFQLLIQNLLLGSLVVDHSLSSNEKAQPLSAVPFYRSGAQQQYFKGSSFWTRLLQSALHSAGSC